MNLSQVLSIFVQRRWIIGVTLVCTVAATLGLSLLLPKSYKATAVLVLNYKGVDSVSGMIMPSQLMPGYIATQVDILNSKSVALKVVDNLHLADNPEVKKNFQDAMNGEGSIREWLADLLRKKLEAVPSRESSVLEVSFTGADPGFAAAVANAFAHEYQQTAIQLSVEPMKKASVYFNNQIKGLRDNLEKAQGRLSSYQQDKGIVSLDNRLDVETARLNDLSTQLVAVQGQLMESSSRQRQAQGSDGADSPDVMANPLTQSLKTSIVQAEARLSDLSQRLGVNHPQYQSAKAELDKLKTQLASQVRAASSAVAGTTRILQRRESELRGALQAQKDKVLELNRARDQLTVLTREIDSAQRAYDLSTQRFNQTSLEGKADQTDVSILAEAVPPAKPTGPKVVLNTLASLFLGTLLGMMFSILAEALDRRLRTEEDFVEALDVPVLATITWSAPKRTPGLVRRFLPFGDRLLTH